MVRIPPRPEDSGELEAGGGADSALEGLSLFIQGFNLTNEPFVAINPGEPLQVMNYQNYGRRFMGGFTYKF